MKFFQEDFREDSREDILAMWIEPLNTFNLSFQTIYRREKVGPCEGPGCPFQQRWQQQIALQHMASVITQNGEALYHFYDVIFPFVFSDCFRQMALRTLIFQGNQATAWKNKENNSSKRLESAKYFQGFVSTSSISSDITFCSQNPQSRNSYAMGDKGLKSAVWHARLLSAYLTSVALICHYRQSRPHC